MKLVDRLRPSGVVPTVIALFALVVAGSGAAVAVTATQVNIADPTTPANRAKVDANGRLATSAAVTTFDSFTYAFAGGGRAVTLTSPTTATLALTDLTYDNGYNRAYANTDYAMTLVKVQVGSSGNCYDSDATTTTYRVDSAVAGQTNSHAFTTPLAFRPTGSKPYCIGVYDNYASASRPGIEYAVGISMAGFAASGKYTGTGTSAVSARPAAPKARHNR